MKFLASGQQCILLTKLGNRKREAGLWGNPRRSLLVQGFNSFRLTAECAERSPSLP